MLVRTINSAVNKKEILALNLEPRQSGQPYTIRILFKTGSIWTLSYEYEADRQKVFDLLTDKDQEGKKKEKKEETE